MLTAHLMSACRSSRRCGPGPVCEPACICADQPCLGSHSRAAAAEALGAHGGGPGHCGDHHPGCGAQCHHCLHDGSGAHCQGASCRQLAPRPQLDLLFGQNCQTISLIVEAMSPVYNVTTSEPSSLWCRLGSSHAALRGTAYHNHVCTCISASDHEHDTICL